MLNRRSEVPLTPVVYTLLWCFSSVVYLLNRPRVQGTPPSGPRLYAANHVSYADVYLASRALIRGYEPIWFLTKKEIRDLPVLGAILTNCYTVFVDRDRPEKAAIEATVRAARSGAVVIFPEGTRSKTLALQEGKAGLGLVARIAHVPVIPVAFVGTERPFWQLVLGRLHDAWRIKIVIGAPYVPPPRARAHDIADAIMRRIASSLPPERRGIYGAPEMASESCITVVPTTEDEDKEKLSHATSHVPRD